MATFPISTIYLIPLLFLSLSVKTNLAKSPPPSLLPSHNHSPLSSTINHIATSPDNNPNSPSPSADYFLPSSTRQMEATAVVGLGGAAGLAINAPFNTCKQCTCCAYDDPNNCSVQQCCYGIVCNLPNKPPDVCLFKPLSCDCNSCN